MYPSPFCNLSRRHWMGGGVQVGCGADGTPPPDTEPPASLPGTLGNGPTGQTPPGNPPPDSGALCVRPLPSGRRRAAPGGDRCRRSPRRTRKPPASLPGTLGDGPTGQTPPGNPPPDSGALCVRPLPSGRRRRRSAPGGDTAQRVRVVCRFEKVTYRCSPRTDPFQLVGCRQHGLVLAGKYLLVVRSSIIFITASFLSWQSNMPMIGFLSISLTSQS